MYRSRSYTALALSLFAVVLVVAAQQGTVAPAVSASAVPGLVKFSGALSGSGAPAGAIGVTFSLYKDQTGGAPLWQETQNVAVAAGGNFTVYLGANHAQGVPPELFASGEARWLGVQPEGQAEQPRVLLASAPYAMKAADANTLAGQPAASFLSNSPDSAEYKALVQTIVQEMTASGTLRPLQASAGPTNFTGNTTNQIVSITQSGSGYALSVNGTGTGINVGASSYGIYATGNTGIDTTGSIYGIQAYCGDCPATTGAAVYAANDSPSGPAFAVYGTNTGTGGVAVRGSAAGIGATRGVQGDTASPSGTGVYGIATATAGTTYGVLGEASSPTGYGVYASAPAYGMKASSTATTGSTYGFIASVYSPQGIAAVFNNNAGGQLASFRNSGVEKASFDASGDFVSQGNVTAGQLISTVTAGTPPLTVTSNTVVPNLNAGLLGGQPSSAYPQLATANSFTSTQLISASNSGALLESINGGVSGKGSGVYAVLGAPSVEGTKSEIPMERGLWADTNANSVTSSALLATADVASAGEFYNASNNVTLYAENDYPLASGSANVLYAAGPTGDFCAVTTSANLNCTGTITGKSLTLPAATGDNRTLETYSVQSTENWYEDYGTGRLTDGTATVALDGDFAQIANTGVEYYVFLTPKGDSAGLYVSNQKASSFEVHESKGGHANIAFDYRIVAKRRGKESLRMRDITTEAGSNKTKVGSSSVAPR
jgi:hypothetical protein